MALLDVKELSVHFGDEKAPFKAVDRISYQVNQGEVLGSEFPCRDGLN